MFRLIGILLALALVAWLALRQVDDTNDALADAAESAGVEVDRDASPRENVEAIGRQVDANIAASKRAVDEAVDDAR